MGQHAGYTLDFAKQIGFSNDVHPIVVERNWSANAQWRAILPNIWNTSQWLLEGPKGYSEFAERAVR